MRAVVADLSTQRYLLTAAAQKLPRGRGKSAGWGPGGILGFVTDEPEPRAAEGAWMGPAAPRAVRDLRQRRRDRPRQVLVRAVCLLWRAATDPRPRDGRGRRGGRPRRHDRRGRAGRGRPGALVRPSRLRPLPLVPRGLPERVRAVRRARRRRLRGPDAGLRRRPGRGLGRGGRRPPVPAAPGGRDPLATSRPRRAGVHRPARRPAVAAPRRPGRGHRAGDDRPARHRRPADAAPRPRHRRGQPRGVRLHGRRWPPVPRGPFPPAHRPSRPWPPAMAGASCGHG